MLVKQIESAGHEIEGGVFTDNGSSANNAQEVWTSSKENHGHVLERDIIVGINDDKQALLDRLTGTQK